MTLPIDLQFKGVGRIHVRSGTYKKQVRDAMREMMRTLYRAGRADVLRDIRAGKISPLAVYERWRVGQIDQLPSAELVRPFAEAYHDWLHDKELSATTVADYERAQVNLAKYGHSLTDLPQMMAAHRKASKGVHPQTYNQDRAAVLSFLGASLGDDHWLYQKVRRVARLKIPVERKMPTNPQTVAELRVLAGKLPPHHARTLWAFALTGMRPEEMFEQGKNRWTLEAERVRIEGAKSTAAKRVVPRIGLIVKPSTGRLAFYRALRKASGNSVTPYDLRRSYTQLLDLAHIPEFRQSHYRGHGPRNMGEHYKRMKECLPYLLEDAAALEKLVLEPLELRIVR